MNCEAGTRERNATQIVEGILCQVGELDLTYFVNHDKPSNILKKG